MSFSFFGFLHLEKYFKSEFNQSRERNINETTPNSKKHVFRFKKNQ
jgi:hypothetical protein